MEDLTTIAKDNDVYREDYIDILFLINSVLWDVEDELRELEKMKDFSDRFIKLAREVYITNDKRASVKKEINERYQSEYSEVKIYSSDLAL